MYGSDKDHLVSVSDGAMVTSHGVSLPASELKSGTTYYFYVSSTDAHGSSVSSQLIPFVAAGDTVSGQGNLKLNKQLFTIVGIGAVILAGILLLFGIYRFQQSIREQRELRSHFPDLNNSPAQNNNGVVNFTPPNGTPGTTTQPNINQQDQNKKV
jgi:hypothetical protein